jgi:hypothetical protein
VRKEEERLELDALVVEEAHRGTHAVLPFLLPTLYFISLVLGDALTRPGVRTLLWVQVAVIGLRWGVLVGMSRAWLKRHLQARTLARAQSTVFIASAWLVSASFAATYLVAAPQLDSSQILTLTVVATAICAVAILSMSSMLISYLGYVVIQLAALLVVMLQHRIPGSA